MFRSIELREIQEIQEIKAGDLYAAIPLMKVVT